MTTAQHNAIEHARCLFCGGEADAPDHLAHCDGRQGHVEAALEPDLRGMTHHDDPYTSHEAAAAIERRRTELHEKVLEAFDAHGAMTDEDLEQLPEFVEYGPSTIRKRRSELLQAGAIIAIGDRRNSRGRRMLIWSRA